MATSLPTLRNASRNSSSRALLRSAVSQLCVPSSALARAPATVTQRRSFFKLPDLGSLSPFAQPSSSSASDKGEPPNTEGLTQTIELPFTPEQLHALVVDVDSYSQFLPYCTHSRVIGPADSKPEDPQGSNAVLAELGIGFGKVQERYTSRVLSVPGQSVEATALSSPLFNHLATKWRFTPSQTGTKVDFTLRYAFASPFYAAIARTACERMAGEMIGAFEKRARQVYGGAR